MAEMNLWTKACLCWMALCSSAFAIRYENTEPTKEILEGLTVEISCKIEEIPGSIQTSFHWIVPAIEFEGETLTSTSVTPDNRFSVQDDIPEPRGDSATVTGSSILTISNVTRSDDGIYQCQLLRNDRERLATIETDLSVIRFDPQTNAACWVEPTSTPKLGDQSIFQCAKRQSNPMQTLTWEAEGVNLEGEQMNEAGITSLEQGLAVPFEWDQRPFLCKDVDTNEVLCSTSVTLRYPPREVSVIPDGEIVYESDARFNCSANARPEVTSYLWLYDGYTVNPATHHRFNRVRLVNDNKTLVLPDLSAVDDAGIEIKCTAFNDIGGKTANFTIFGKQPRSPAQIIGPVLFCVILVIIILVCLAFYCWWRGQRRMVRKISTKRKRANNTRQKSELPTSVNDYSGAASFVAVSPMDLEAIGYGPDISHKPSQVEPTDRQDRDSGVGDDGIRPIPRRGSVSSSLGKANFGFEDDEQSQSDMNFESPDAPVDANEEKLKSYSYEVNPNFNSYRRSQTFDVVTIPTSENDDSDTEIKSIPPGEDSSDDERANSPTPSGHIVSTNL